MSTNAKRKDNRSMEEMHLDSHIQAAVVRIIQQVAREHGPLPEKVNVHFFDPFGIEEDQLFHELRMDVIQSVINLAKECGRKEVESRARDILNRVENAQRQWRISFQSNIRIARNKVLDGRYGAKAVKIALASV